MPEIDSSDPADDAFIEDLIERASRAIDAYCGAHFYSNTATRYFNLPSGRQLWLDAMPLLTVTTLTNGDGSTIASTEYDLLPLNVPSKHRIRLKDTSGVSWQPATSGNTVGVISVAGTWGYVNRASTDPESMRIILNTEEACLLIAVAAYKRRYGQGIEGAAQVTGAGVVITPRNMPVEARRLLDPYKRVI